jgi:hypothetical protein
LSSVLADAGERDYLPSPLRAGLVRVACPAAAAGEMLQRRGIRSVTVGGPQRRAQGNKPGRWPSPHQLTDAGFGGFELARVRYPRTGNAGKPAGSPIDGSPIGPPPKSNGSTSRGEDQPVGPRLSCPHDGSGRQVRRLALAAGADRSRARTYSPKPLEARPEEQDRPPSEW